MDLSDLGITDDDLARFPFKSGSIRLANNRITDLGIGLLFSDANYYYRSLLDLSNNSIDGSGFTVLCTINRLVLDGNPLLDGTFGPQLKNLMIEESMVLRNTKLTDSFLKNLSTAKIGGIDLGDGNFTEAGLKNLGTMENRKLSLTGKQFTGKCFEDWSPICIALSMRGSSINDDTLAYVAMLTRVSALDLSNTAITDSGLASPSVRSLLSKLSVLNLSDTRVTAKGLMDLKLPNRLRILHAPSQFTTEEVTLLGTKGLLKVAENSPAYIEAARKDWYE